MKSCRKITTKQFINRVGKVTWWSQDQQLRIAHRVGELEKIVRVNGEFRFGDEYSFPCSVETAYRSTKGNRYTLETLIHYIKNHHLKHTEYFQNTFALGIPSVTLPDRKPILQYLQGSIASTDSIEYRPEDPSFAPPAAAAPPPEPPSLHPKERCRTKGA